jgi:hypothetical protein
MDIDNIKLPKCKIITLEDKQIIFINDNTNKHNYAKTQQLNAVIFKMTNINILDVNIYKKEKIQKGEQNIIKKLTIENLDIKENKLPELLKKINETKSILELSSKTLDENHYKILEYKESIKELENTYKIYELDYSKNLKKIIKSTKLINDNQLTELEVEKNKNIRENALLHFEIDKNFIVTITKNEVIKEKLKKFKCHNVKDNVKDCKFKCICSQTNCSELYLLKSKDKNIYFALGSDCIGRIHEKFFDELNLCIFENKRDQSEKCIKCNCILFDKQYQTYDIKKNYDASFRGNCLTCFIELIKENEETYKKILKDLNIKNVISFSSLKEYIKKEDELIATNNYKRCLECSILIENSDKKIIRCKKCWCNFMKYSSYVKLNFIEDDD